MSVDEFNERITAGDLAEYETVHDDMYGTLKAPIDSAFENNHVLLLDIDVKGAKNLKETYGDECVTIFIQPPSIEVLKQRLIDRGSETETSFEKRVDRIEMEMEEGKHFNFQVINDSIEDAVNEVAEIIENKRSEIVEES
jgi:guanylate kinase